jgi:hypothetical protein
VVARMAPWHSARDCCPVMFSAWERHIQNYSYFRFSSVPPGESAAPRMAHLYSNGGSPARCFDIQPPLISHQAVNSRHCY